MPSGKNSGVLFVESQFINQKWLMKRNIQKTLGLLNGNKQIWLGGNEHRIGNFSFKFEYVWCIMIKTGEDYLPLVVFGATANTASWSKNEGGENDVGWTSLEEFEGKKQGLSENQRVWEETVGKMLEVVREVSFGRIMGPRFVPVCYGVKAWKCYKCLIELRRSSYRKLGGFSERPFNEWIILKCTKHWKSLLQTFGWGKMLVIRNRASPCRRGGRNTTGGVANFIVPNGETVTSHAAGEHFWEMKDTVTVSGGRKVLPTSAVSAWAESLGNRARRGGMGHLQPVGTWTCHARDIMQRWWAMLYHPAFGDGKERRRKSWGRHWDENLTTVPGTENGKHQWSPILRVSLTCLMILKWEVPAMCVLPSSACQSPGVDASQCLCAWESSHVKQVWDSGLGVGIECPFISNAWEMLVFIWGRGAWGRSSSQE